MSDLIEQLKVFIEKSRNVAVARRWITDGELHIYLRKEFRVSHGVCLSVGDAEFLPKRFEDFIEFLKILHGRNPYDCTAVDSVFFRETLERLAILGWRRQTVEDNAGEHGSMFRCTTKDSASEFLGGTPTGGP